MITIQKSSVQIAYEPFNLQVSHMVERMAALWWDCPAGLPDLGPQVPPRRQRENEKLLASRTDGLLDALKHLPAGDAARGALRSRLLEDSFEFVQATFGFTGPQLEVIRRNGFIEAAEEFARQARRYDPAIRGEDIYQASRNVMTANFMQMLLGLPVEVTPAVFAYSMLYPYTDNYLDDPSISLETKTGFNRRFYRRLAGEDARPTNAQEERIWDLVGMVEGQWDRARYPPVYESLLAIHTAQGKSLRQSGGVSPYEVDVLRTSFEKGGASVLADGYLAAGTLTGPQFAFMFGYGAFTQLMDDLEDVEADHKAGYMTLFSQTAGHWPLDALTSRALHFGARVFEDVDTFPVADARPLKEMIQKAIPPMLSISASGAARYYTGAYLRELEARMPFRFRALQAQQKKLERSRFTLMSLVDFRG